MHPRRLKGQTAPRLGKAHRRTPLGARRRGAANAEVKAAAGSRTVGHAMARHRRTCNSRRTPRRYQAFSPQQGARQLARGEPHREGPPIDDPLGSLLRDCSEAAREALPIHLLLRRICARSDPNECPSDLFEFGGPDALTAAYRPDRLHHPSRTLRRAAGTRCHRTGDFVLAPRGGDRDLHQRLSSGRAFRRRRHCAPAARHLPAGKGRGVSVYIVDELTTPRLTKEGRIPDLPLRFSAAQRVHSDLFNGPS